MTLAGVPVPASPASASLGDVCFTPGHSGRRTSLDGTEARYACGCRLSRADYDAGVEERRVRATPAAPVSSVSSVSSHKGVPAALPAVPPFPVESLPPVARRVVTQGAAALDCPADFLAAPLLAMVGGVVGNRLALELKVGYRQRCILWTAAVGHPGTAKSPAFAVVQGCVDVLQREAHERRQRDKEAHQTALDRWQGEDKATRGPRPELPRDEEHFYTTDSTAEGLARMLGGEQAATPGLTITREELVGWVNSFDQYKAAKGGERQTHLSMWAGMAFKSDRAGRDSIYVPEPVVCVTGGIQPDVLPALAPEAGERDGFIERVLFAYPDARAMRWSDATVRQHTLDALTAAFRRLREAPAGVVALGREAAARYAGWVNENARLQEATKGLIRGYYAKLPNQVARLALALHCLARPADPAGSALCLATMEAALAVGEYFRAHAHRTFAHFGEAVLVDHPLSIRVLRALPPETWTPTKELHKLLGGHAPADELQAALEELQTLRLVERRSPPVGQQGGRPRVEWRLARTSTEETEETEETPTGEAPSRAAALPRADAEAVCAVCGRPANAVDRDRLVCFGHHPMGTSAPALVGVA